MKAGKQKPPFNQCNNSNGGNVNSKAKYLHSKILQTKTALPCKVYHENFT